MYPTQNSGTCILAQSQAAHSQPTPTTNPLVDSPHSTLQNLHHPHQTRILDCIFQTLPTEGRYHPPFEKGTKRAFLRDKHPSSSTTPRSANYTHTHKSITKKKTLCRTLFFLFLHLIFPLLVDLCAILVVRSAHQPHGRRVPFVAPHQRAKTGKVCARLVVCPSSDQCGTARARKIVLRAAPLMIRDPKATFLESGRDGLSFLLCWETTMVSKEAVVIVSFVSSRLSLSCIPNSQQDPTFVALGSRKEKRYHHHHR